MRRLGEAGFGADVTSGGELFLALHAGISPQKIIFSGVGKTAPEIHAALDAGIRAIHVESEMELEAIAAIAAQRGQTASIGVRVNPNISVETHPYISTGLHAHKFGVTPDRAMTMLHEAAKHPHLQPVGLAAHIGSQITAVSPFVQSAEFLVEMAQELAAGGIQLTYLDVGGGLGINYAAQDAPAIQEWATAVATPVRAAGYGLVLEPGRSVVGPIGALVTAVTYTKRQGEKTFVITDTGMSDLLRPTLYNAYHPIWPLREQPDAAPIMVDVVGPICETGDWLARERPLPPQQAGDLLAILQAGAYGYAMSSNYNGRLRPPELLVSQSEYTLIRQRQRYEQLL
ncbi:MAG: diaminopimelate decarboxylase [Chloroflexota bacterium]